MSPNKHAATPDEGIGIRHGFFDGKKIDHVINVDERLGTVRVIGEMAELNQQTFTLQGHVEILHRDGSKTVFATGSADPIRFEPGARRYFIKGSK